LNYLSTTAIGKLCGCTRIWAFNKARDGFFDEFKLAGWHGKHYRFKDCPKLRAQCRAIKADRERARRRKPKSKSGWAGVSTWRGLATQFDLMLRQVGGMWKQWNASEIDAVLGELSEIFRFGSQLQFRKRDLLRLKNR
jgi:hypothetical protein